MIVDPDKVDAFLEKKGIKLRMSDSEWESALRVLTPFLGGNRCFQVKLLHQQEDSLRRFSSAFPDSIPTPYRFIDYLSFVAGGSTPEKTLVRTLEHHSIPFVARQKRNGPEDDDRVTIVFIGPRENPIPPSVAPESWI